MHILLIGMGLFVVGIAMQFIGPRGTLIVALISAPMLLGCGRADNYAPFLNQCDQPTFPQGSCQSAVNGQARMR